MGVSDLFSIVLLTAQLLVKDSFYYCAACLTDILLLLGRVTFSYKAHGMLGKSKRN